MLLKYFVIRCLEQQGVVDHFSSYRGTTSFWDKPMSKRTQTAGLSSASNDCPFQAPWPFQKGLVVGPSWVKHLACGPNVSTHFSATTLGTFGHAYSNLYLLTVRFRFKIWPTRRMLGILIPEKKHEKYMTIQYSIPVRKDLSYLWFFLRDLHAKQNFLLPLPPLLHLPCRGHPWWDGCQMGDGSMLAGAML